MGKRKGSDQKCPEPHGRVSLSEQLPTSALHGSDWALQRDFGLVRCQTTNCENTEGPMSLESHRSHLLGLFVFMRLCVLSACMSVHICAPPACSKYLGRPEGVESLGLELQTVIRPRCLCWESKHYQSTVFSSTQQEESLLLGQGHFRRSPRFYDCSQGLSAYTAWAPTVFFRFQQLVFLLFTTLA